METCCAGQSKLIREIIKNLLIKFEGEDDAFQVSWFDNLCDKILEIGIAGARTALTDVMTEKKIAKFVDLLQHDGPLAIALKNLSASQSRKSKKLQVIVMGLTGAGKSSLINMLYCWSQGWQTLEQFKHTMIQTKYFKGLQGGEGELVHDQSKSQTQKCSNYQFPLKTNSINYELMFMDTPGLADVRGVEQDEINIKEILKSVAATDTLNAIIVMINGTNPRLSPSILFAIEKIKSILPNVVKENLIIFLSNSEFQPNLELERNEDGQKIYLLGHDVPADRQFFFNNPIFNCDPQNKSTDVITTNNKCYQNCMVVVGKALKKISEMSIQDKDAFVQIRQRRDTFKSSIQTVKAKTSGLLELTQKLQMVKLNQSDQIDELISKMFEVDVWNCIQTDTHNTRCLSCYSNCHESCFITETTQIGHNIFKSCAAFGGKSNCCECGCSFKHHVHLRELWKKVRCPYTVFDQASISRILQQSGSNKIEQFQKEIDLFVSKLQTDIEQNRKKTHQFINEFKTVCSAFNYKTEVACLIRMLEERCSQTTNQNELDYLNSEKKLLLHLFDQPGFNI